MILRSVEHSELQGKNIRLTLACGHSILRGKRQVAKAPKSAVCPFCPVSPLPEDNL